MNCKNKNDDKNVDKKENYFLNIQTNLMCNNRLKVSHKIYSKGITRGFKLQLISELVLL